MFLVLAGHARGVEEGAHGRDEVLVVARVDLREGGTALGHLLGDDADCALEGVHGVHELLLAGGEGGLLLLADGRGLVQLLGVLGDRRDKLLDLRLGVLDGGAQLADLGRQLLLLGRGRLDGEGAVLGGVVAPLSRAEGVRLKGVTDWMQ